MHDALGNALVIEVRDLLAQDEVLEQRRAAQPGLERVLVVGDRHALVGRQRAPAGIDAHAIERVSGRDSLRASVAAPTLADEFVSVSVLAPTRIRRLDGLTHLRRRPKPRRTPSALPH